jgi:uncharacterized membrane protein YcaP (DUF421 family)
MRLMGKRQIGELEITDLVTTLLISEIAALPITNQDIPLAHAIIPMVLLLSLEVTSSVILIRLPRLKNLVSARPTMLMRGGVLNQKALREMRMSMDELISEARQQGYTSLGQIDYAILEKDGKMTILPKSRYMPPTAADFGLTVSRDQLMHVVYSNGAYSDAGLAVIGRDRTWLNKALAEQSIHLKEQFCITANEGGEIFCIPKEDTT